MGASGRERQQARGHPSHTIRPESSNHSNHRAGLPHSDRRAIFWYRFHERKMNPTASIRPARLERLRVRNFRALYDVEFQGMRPLTALLGPNGSGKSTVFDVFAFLADCFESGLRRAWDRRGRAREIKSRGSDGPVTIEIKYRERPGRPLITYHLAVDEQQGRPSVKEEWLSWRRGRWGKPFRFLEYRGGMG